MSNGAFLGIDLGTSGVRASVVDDEKNTISYHAVPMPAPVMRDGQSTQDTQIWLHAVEQCLTALASKTDCSNLQAVAIDGTSSSVLLCGQDGTALTPALMYNDVSAIEQAGHIKHIAPENCGAHGASSSLAKVLSLRQHVSDTDIHYICHQADYVASWLSGRYGISDENNCLKLGYDSSKQCWPDWLQACKLPTHWLPTVLKPGSSIQSISKRQALKFGINPHCKIVSGTTDSIAAFIATGANATGDAVTSLGSTLVVKLISDTAIFSSTHGIYSHAYYADNKRWLVGGASNAGCRVLRDLFTQQQLDDMTAQLNPNHSRSRTHDYYPLPQGVTGERFPTPDPHKQGKLTPRPHSDLEYFHALLKSITQLEKQSYCALEKMGAGKVKQIFTTGGGSKNAVWNTIRQQQLGIPVCKAPHTEASYGSALLARHALMST